MKKIYTLTAIIIASLFSANTEAQSLRVTSDSTNLTGPANVLMVGYARVENISGGTISIKVRRTQVDTASGHSSYFCWTGTCYPFTVNESPNYIDLFPGESDTTLQADVNPRGFTGRSIVTYCFYDKDNIADSACITYTYEATVVGIKELAGLRSLSNPYPNPAGHFARVTYSISHGKDFRLVISNVLGSAIKEIPLFEKQGIVNIPTADLPSGIYVCTVQIDGKSAGAKKLIVSHP